MRKYLFLLCLFFPLFAKAQNTNGIVGGINYMMYKPGGDDKTTDAEATYNSHIGFGLGYRFYWNLYHKWNVGTGLSLYKYTITGTYLQGTTFEQVDDELVIYASLPLVVNYSVCKKINFIGGYQYSYLLTSEYTDGNLNDHALTIGASYQLPFCSFQLLYQQSLNSEKKENSKHYLQKLNGFHLQVYIPLNKRKDKKD